MKRKSGGAKFKVQTLRTSWGTTVVSRCEIAGEYALRLSALQPGGYGKSIAGLQPTRLLGLKPGDRNPTEAVFHVAQGDHFLPWAYHHPPLPSIASDNNLLIIQQEWFADLEQPDLRSRLSISNKTHLPHTSFVDLGTSRQWWACEEVWLPPLNQQSSLILGYTQSS